MAAEFETEYTKELVCPYCGHEDSYPDELVDEDGETDCGECGKPFYYSRLISVSYTSKKKDGVK